MDIQAESFEALRRKNKPKFPADAYNKCANGGLEITRHYGSDGVIKEYSPWRGFSLGEIITGQNITAGNIFNPQSYMNTQIAANNAAAQARLAAAQNAQWAAVQAQVSIPNGQAAAAAARANLAAQQNGQAPPYGYTQPGYSAPSAGNPGYAIDPNTGYYIDPVTGLDINPQTGQDIPAGQTTAPYGGGYYPTPPAPGGYAVYPAQPGYQPNPSYPTY